MHDAELLSVLASLDAWKQGLPRYERDAGKGLPMLTQDRLLKGYYMVCSLSCQLPRDTAYRSRL